MQPNTSLRGTLGAMVRGALLALVIGLMLAQGASADTKTINDRANALADGCAKSGGKGNTHIDADNHVIFTCKGAKGGSYECDISTAVPICGPALAIGPGATGSDLTQTNGSNVITADTSTPVRPGRVTPSRAADLQSIEITDDEP